MDESECLAASLSEADPEVAQGIEAEIKRQGETIELIASENHCSAAVRQAQGSVLTDKYAEGYVGARWYAGCGSVDVLERLAIDRAKGLFGAEHANVQPHSGSQANMAVYMAVLRPGAKILGMSLAHGGHLTHGHKKNFSGQLYQVLSYGISRETGLIDYEEVRMLAERHSPDLVVAGASAYSREMDYRPFREIADSIGAYLLADMAHIAGLVAAGLHNSPVPYADFVSSTTHKTLRGPRGGFVLCKEEFASQLDAAVFPGIQGGPMMHVIAAKAVALKEASTPEFKQYQKQVVSNARAMAAEFMKLGFQVVSGGTDTHLFLLDLSDHGLTGAEVEQTAARAGIMVNRNAIPFDLRGPAQASGVRIGTPAVTTRGMKEEEMRTIAGLIADILSASDRDAVVAHVRPKVAELCGRFPVDCL